MAGNFRRGGGPGTSAGCRARSCLHVGDNAAERGGDTRSRALGRRDSAGAGVGALGQVGEHVALACCELRGLCRSRAGPSGTGQQKQEARRE